MKKSNFAGDCSHWMLDRKAVMFQKTKHFLLPPEKLGAGCKAEREWCAVYLFVCL